MVTVTTCSAPGSCVPRGPASAELDGDPDRLTRPLVRRDGHLTEVGWEEAFAVVADGLGAVVAEHGGRSVGVYLGNPNAHTIAGALYPPLVIRALGTRNVFSASTLDQMPKQVALGHMFGNPFAFTVPDLDRTDHLVMIGANPMVSNGSLATAADFPGKLRALRKRGGRLTVIDPARTRTAELADRHLAPRPGTDGVLLFAIVHVLFDEGLVAEDLGGIGEHVVGVEAVRTLADEFAPEVVATHCGIAAQDIRELARDIAAASVGGGVRADRHVDRRVRHPGQLAGRRRQRPDRQPRPARRGDVPARPDGTRAPTRPARPRVLHRPLAQPRLRVSGSRLGVSDRRARRGDRHPRRRSDPGDDHHRRQSGAVGARR